MRVVHHKNNVIRAVDEADWEHRIPLTTRDIVIHQFDLRTARTALCDLLTGVTIARTPVEQTAVRVQIGNWEPQKAASFPVYLLLCPMREVLRREMLELQHELQHRNPRSGAILLTPTRACWDDGLEALARSQKMLLVPLCEILQAHNGTISKTPAWEEYLQAFCQMVRLSLPGNFQNKRPVPMRGTRTASIEKIEKFLIEHILAARDHAYTRKSHKLEPTLLPRPEQQDIARLLGLSEPSVSRCFRDKRATILKILWETAGSLDSVMKFKPRQ